MISDPRPAYASSRSPARWAANGSPDTYRLSARAVEPVQFEYELDLFLRIGGDIMPITDPTGLYNPRVSVAKHRVTANILINTDEALAAPNPGELLRTTIYNAMIDLFARIHTRDTDFDADAAQHPERRSLLQI